MKSETNIQYFTWRISVLCRTIDIQKTYSIRDFCGRAKWFILQYSKHSAEWKRMAGTKRRWQIAYKETEKKHALYMREENLLEAQITGQSVLEK